jgi:hypothetical protein
VFIGLYMASLDRARSPRSFAAELLRVSHEMNVPIWRAQSPEEVSVYLPIDLPDASAAGRVLIAVDDPKHAFAGSPRAFEAGIPGIRVREERELQLPTAVTTRRYRLFEVTFDRGEKPIAQRIERMGERVWRAALHQNKGGVTEVTPPREIEN